jgi:hypothetical protein
LGVIAPSLNALKGRFEVRRPGGHAQQRALARVGDQFAFAVTEGQGFMPRRQALKREGADGRRPQAGALQKNSPAGIVFIAMVHGASSFFEDDSLPQGGRCGHPMIGQPLPPGR